MGVTSLLSLTHIFFMLGLGINPPPAIGDSLTADSPRAIGDDVVKARA
jgi:hypothetical protein